MNLNHLVYIDVETGGLKALKNPITQIGMIATRIDTFEEMSRFTCYVQPYDNLAYEQKALDYTKTTMEMIHGGISIENAMSGLCQQLLLANPEGKQSTKPTLCGHNITFDINFLVYAAKKCKIDLKKYLNTEEDIFGNQIPIYVDTWRLAQLRWSHEKIENFKLGTCCEKAGVDLITAHEAMSDIVASKDLLIHFTQSMRSSGSSLNPENKNSFRKTFQL